MLSHELVLKLKEAGFPQVQRWGKVLEKCYCGSEEYSGENKIHAANSNCLLIEPTLSELIKECGYEVFRLYVVGNEYPEWFGKWRARNIHVEGKEILAFDSPDEAVANLYLAITKK